MALCISTRFFFYLEVFFCHNNVRNYQWLCLVQNLHEIIDLYRFLCNYWTTREQGGLGLHYDHSSVSLWSGKRPSWRSFQRLPVHHLSKMLHVAMSVFFLNYCSFFTDRLLFLSIVATWCLDFFLAFLSLDDVPFVSRYPLCLGIYDFCSSCIHGLIKLVNSGSCLMLEYHTHGSPSFGNSDSLRSPGSDRGSCLLLILLHCHLLQRHS